MFKNYIVIAIRNIINNKLYAFINIGGLSVGLASCVLIMLFVRDELSYDTFLQDHDRIYRFETTLNLPGRAPVAVVTAHGPLRDALLAEFPEIEQATRLLQSNATVFQDAARFSETVARVDREFFNVLQLPFVEGNPETVVAGVKSVVLTEAMANKYFPGISAMGQTLTLNINGTGQRDYEVTGVLKNIPENSHLVLDIITSINTEDFPASAEGQTGLLNTWQTLPFFTYVKLSPNAGPENMVSRLPNLIDRRVPPSLAASVNMAGSELFELRMVALPDIHLDSNPLGTMKPKGDMGTIYAFVSIAVLILIVASINFINLATARSSGRAREIAMRKVMGASRSHIIVQFLGEALIMTCFALLVALTLVEIALPYYNSFFSMILSLSFIENPTIILGFTGLVIVVGIGAGAYPAFLISSIRPAHALSASRYSAMGSATARTTLVVIQFSISIGLIIATTIIYSQSLFARSFDLGFDKENILIVRAGTEPEVRASTKAFMDRIAQHADIVGITRSNSVPTDTFEGSTSVRLPEFAEPVLIGARSVDFGFFETYGVKPVAGRLFSQSYGTDRRFALNAVTPTNPSSILINETGLQQLGFKTPEEAIGKTIFQGIANPSEATIVGVVPDIHFRSVRNGITAEIYYINENTFDPISIRYETENLGDLTKYIDVIWSEMFPDVPITREFLEDNISAQYLVEDTNGAMLAGFAALAVIVSSLGLLGLASFTAEQRTKEIGIRKVLGASTFNIVRLLLWQFSKPIVLANLIAWPVAFYFMQDWLNGFQYRIDLSIAYFVPAAVFALLIAWATVGAHSLRTARSNPISALRCE